MILAKLFPARRPYWHVDLKWVFGILLFFALGSALLLFNLSALTERERATNMSATIVASLFSKNGLDDEKDLDAFRQQAAAIPGDTVTPIPQYPWLQISKQDVETKTPRELRIAIFRQLTDPIYDKGLAGAATQFSADPTSQEQFKKDAALLGVFTRTTHEALSQAFTWSVVAAVVLLILLIYFSSGWGRLVSPGVVLLLTSPLGAIFGFLLLYPPTDGDGPLAALPASVAQEIGTGLSQSYARATMLGVALIIVAGLGKLTQTWLKRRRKTAP